MSNHTKPDFPFDDCNDEHLRNHPLHPFLHDHGVAETDDQLPIVARVGRGLRGDTFGVKLITPDDCTQTYLEGFTVDAHTGEVHSEWISDNINGGELSYQYRLRPYTTPQTFTITFIYRRPSGPGAMTRHNDEGKLEDVSAGKKPTTPRDKCIGVSPGKRYDQEKYSKEPEYQPKNCSWSWTTPAIPYVWDVNGDGLPDADEVVGCGAATVFVRTDSIDWQKELGAPKGNPKDNDWIDTLVYPPGTTYHHFNRPDPEAPWTVNLTFGIKNGTVLVPHLYDLSLWLGFDAQNLYQHVQGQTKQYAGGIRFTWGHLNDKSNDLKNYIDDNDKWIMDHIHKDLGFDQNLPGQGDSPEAPSVKEYIDDEIKKAMDHFHKDLGWLADDGFDPEEYLEGDGDEEDPNSVRDYLDKLKKDLEAKITQVNKNIEATNEHWKNAITDILNHIYPAGEKEGADYGKDPDGTEPNPAGELDATGHITWFNKNAKIPVAKLNVYSGGTEISNVGGFIRSRDDETQDDLWAK